MGDTIESLSGQTVQVRARVGVSGPSHLVLERVIINGTIPKDHAWIKKSKRFINLLKGDWITFTANVCEYKSVVDEKLVTKYGFDNKRNIRRIS